VISANPGTSKNWRVNPISAVKQASMLQCCTPPPPLGHCDTVFSPPSTKELSNLHNWQKICCTPPLSDGGPDRKRHEQATARYLYHHQRDSRVSLRYKEGLELRPCCLPWVPLSGKVEAREFEVSYYPRMVTDRVRHSLDQDIEKLRKKRTKRMALTTGCARKNVTYFNLP
jgi:hypothetical protein